MSRSLMARYGRMCACGHALYFHKVRTGRGECFARIAPSHARCNCKSVVSA